MIERLLTAAGIAFAIIITSSPSATADDPVPRLALVIGNAVYPDAEAPLKEVIADTRAVADELRHDGFEVTTGENLGRAAMSQALDSFYAKIKPGAIVLVFFSGYGLEAARQTFIIPVDAQIWTEADIHRAGINLDSMLDEINSRGAGAKLVILDASRRNPFDRRFRSYSDGLAPPTAAQQNALVMFSAAPGTVIADADTDHGLFVGELVKEMRAPDLSAEEALLRTRNGVGRASGGAQVPWISSTLTVDFSFSGSVPLKVTPPNVIIDNSNDGKKPPPLPPPNPDDKDRIEIYQNDPTFSALTELINKNPNDEISLYKRGRFLASKGAYKLALADLDRAIVLDPKDVQALNNRCFVDAIIGDLQTALDNCNTALQLRPYFADALDSRGLVYLKLDRNADAIGDFNAVLKLNPKMASSLYGRGVAQQRTGQGDAGSADLRAALQIDPDLVSEFASYGVR